MLPLVTQPSSTEGKPADIELSVCVGHADLSLDLQKQWHVCV